MQDNIYIEDFVRKKKITIIDAGCAGGIDPIFIELVKKNYAKAYGFDGNKKEIERLSKQNNISNIFFYNNLLTDKNEDIKFYRHGSVGSINRRYDRETLYKEKYDEILIKSITLDKFIENEKLSNAIILKVDVEGSEMKLLKGADGAIQNQVICIKIEFNYDSKQNTNNFYDIHKYLISNNFQLMNISNDENSLFGIHSGDALYLKNIEFFKRLELEKSAKNEIIIQNIFTLLFLKKNDYAALFIEIFNNNIPLNIYNQVWKKILDKIFIPNLLPFSFPKLSFLSFIFTMFFAGNKYHTKSFPKLNRLVQIKYFFINPFFKTIKSNYKKNLLNKIKRYMIMKK